jgi:uncharacterized protein YndB with AHSA1/START domain
MKPFGPERQGTRTLNLNRRNRMFWPSACTVVEVVPDRKLAFRVDANKTVWSYELESTGEGTRLIESRHAENGVTAFSNLSVKALFGGTDNFESELVDGMNASLARIKAAAEDATRG